MRRIGVRNERNIICINNFICCGQGISKTKGDRLILLDEVLLVHTDENID